MQTGMQARDRATWPSGDDYIFFSLLVVVFGLAFFGYMAWTLHHADIARGFAWLAHWHIAAIRRFTNEYDSLDAQLLSAEYGRVTLKGIYAAATSIGLFFRIPAVVLLGLLALLCLARAAPSRFRRRFDLDGLIAEQARSFRTIAAFATRRLRLAPIAAGDPRPADPALHPVEWLDRYAPLVGGKRSDAAIHAALTRQLGPRWRGARDADAPARVLFAAFALHLARDRKGAMALLGDMAEALRPANRDAEGETGPAAPLVLPPSFVARADIIIVGTACGEAGLIAGRHAFSAPALMSLLTEARQRSGVLPPAAFNGLKLVDRRLWYALHSLGFPSEGQGRTYHPNPCIEAIGARDHWAMELALGKPVTAPSLARAMATIRAIDGPHASGRPAPQGATA